LIAIYNVVARRVPVISLSHHQASTAGRVPVATVIHHGVDPDLYPVGEGDGGFALFLGRMDPNKGVHQAIEVARAAGVPLLIAARQPSTARTAAAGWKNTSRPPGWPPTTLPSTAQSPALERPLELQRGERGCRRPRHGHAGRGQLLPHLWTGGRRGQHRGAGAV